MNAIGDFLGLQKRSQTATLESLQTKVLQSNRTKSGVPVEPQDMVEFAPLWKGLQDIPQHVAKCPLYIIERTTVDGQPGRQRAENHPAFVLFADYPNERQGAVEFWQQSVFHKVLYHRSIIWMDKSNNGRITGLYNLLPDRTFYDPTIDKYVSQIGQDGYAEFFPSEILDVKSPQSPFINCEFAKVARESIGVGLAAQDHSSKFLASDCQPGGILEIPAGFTKKAKDNLERGLRERMSGNQFKTLVLGDGAKWHQAQIDAEKSQLTETRLYQAREVAMWLNMAPSRLGLPDSGGYGSRSEDNLDFKDTTIVPHLNAYASECGLKVLTRDQQRRRTHYFEHNTDKLYTLDPKTRAEVGKIEQEAGFTNANEYRRAKNQNPRPNGEKFWEPNANHVLDSGEESTETESDAVDTARMVLREQGLVWIDKTLAKISKECQRKNANRFCNWFDSYVPEDYRTFFNQAVKLNVTQSTQDALFLRIKEGVNRIMEETTNVELPVAITEFCENIKPNLKGELNA